MSDPILLSAINKCPKDKDGAVDYKVLTAMVGCMKEVEEWRKEKGYKSKERRK